MPGFLFITDVRWLFTWNIGAQNVTRSSIAQQIWPLIDVGTSPKTMLQPSPNLLLKTPKSRKRKKTTTLTKMMNKIKPITLAKYAWSHSREQTVWGNIWSKFIHRHQWQVHLCLLQPQQLPSIALLNFWVPANQLNSRKIAFLSRAFCPLTFHYCQELFLFLIESWKFEQICLSF